MSGDRIPSRIGDRYEVGPEAGRGGLGRVYSATDTKLEQEVALKVLWSELTAAVGTDNVLHELGVAARLNHPNILPVLDTGVIGDDVYYVTPFVDGPTLLDHLKTHGPLQLPIALQVADQVARAVSYGNQHHVVHRDINPANVFLTDDRVIVKDFWIARALATAGKGRFGFGAARLGTLQYMSPEQSRLLSTTDERSDVYSLACLLHEMITGKPAVGGPWAAISPDQDATALQHLQDTVLSYYEPGTPEQQSMGQRVPEAFANAIRRALAVSAEDRFATATEFVDACYAATHLERPTRFLLTLSTAPEIQTRGGDLEPGEFTTLFGSAPSEPKGTPLDVPSPAGGEIIFDEHEPEQPAAGVYFAALSAATEPELDGSLPDEALVTGGPPAVRGRVPTAPIFAAKYKMTRPPGTVTARAAPGMLRRIIAAIARFFRRLFGRRKAVELEKTPGATLEEVPELYLGAATAPAVEEAPEDKQQAAPTRPVSPPPITSTADLQQRLADALRYRYDVQDEVGRGGMALVFRARDLRLARRTVALKVLRPELTASVASERFLLEIDITAQLVHPQILPLFDSGDADGLLFYVMPYLAGEPLRERIRSEGKLQLDEAITIAKDVAGALDYAHRQGVIHRDIKPENIIYYEGRAVVADFGIALALDASAPRMTEPGFSPGTPEYMSPEQFWEPDKVDHRADLYSLGCVLYEMLTGKPPFKANTLQQLAALHLTGEVPAMGDVRESVPQSIELAIKRVLEKTAANRFATGAEFAAALTAA